MINKMALNIQKKLTLKSLNSQQLLKNLFQSFFVKGLSIVVGFLTLPLYLKFFSNQKSLGTWLVMVSFANLIFNFDLGLGNGLRNRLTDAVTRNDNETSKKLVSSAYAVIITIVTLATIIFFMLRTYCNWNKILNISNEDLNQDTLTTVVTILFVGTMVQFVLKLINAVFNSYQKPAVPSFLMLLTNSSLILFLYISNLATISNDIIVLSIAYVLTACLPAAIVSIYMFAGKWKALSPSPSYISLNHITKILSLGISFFFLQLLAIIIFSINDILIAKLVSPSEVVTYQAYNKLIGAVSMVYMLTMSTSWSAITQAQTQGNYPWILSLNKKIHFSILFAVFAYIVVWATIPYVLPAWLGEQFSVINYLLLFTIIVKDLVFIWNGIVSNFACGLSKLKTAYIFVAIGAIINIPLAIWFTDIFGKAITAIIVANILSMLPYCVAESYSTYKMLKRYQLYDRKD